MSTHIEIGIKELVDTHVPYDAAKPWLIPRNKLVDMLEKAWLMLDLKYKPNGDQHMTYYSPAKDMYYEAAKGWVKRSSRGFSETKTIPSYPSDLQTRQVMIIDEEEDMLNFYFFQSNLIEDEEEWDLTGFCSYFINGNREDVVYYKKEHRYLLGTDLNGFMQKFGDLNWMDSPMYITGDVSGLFSGIKTSIQMAISRVLRYIRPVGGVSDPQPMMSIFEIRDVLKKEVLKTSHRETLYTFLWLMEEITLNKHKTVETLQLIYKYNLEAVLTDVITLKGKHSVMTTCGIEYNASMLLDVEEDVLLLASGYGSKLNLPDILKLDMIFKDMDGTEELKEFIEKLANSLEVESHLIPYRSIIDKTVLEIMERKKKKEIRKKR